MSDEYNKGYYSAGPQRSYEAQQGQADRRDAERQARQAAEQAARVQRLQDQDRMIKASKAGQTIAEGHTTGPTITTPAAPLTLLSSVQGFAIAGAVIFFAYAAFSLNMTSWGVLAKWGLQGAIAGAVAGVGIYVAVVVLRVAAVILGYFLKVAFFLGLAYVALQVLQGMG